MKMNNRSDDWFIQLLQYGNWQFDRIYGALQQTNLLDHERVKLLVPHITRSRFMWHSRCTKVEHEQSVTLLPVADTPRQFTYATQLWVDYLTGLDADIFEIMISYTDAKGNNHHTPLCDIIEQVVNHSTHHLGELVRLIRISGGEPPQTDFIAFSHIYHKEQ